jgi:hypothetical protein
MKNSTPRVQKHRENLQKTEDQKASKLSDLEAQKSIRKAIDLLSGAGIPVPSLESLQTETFPNQMLGIQRLLCAAQMATKLAVSRGELRKVSYLDECLGRLMAYMRRTLRNAPARADSLGLSPDLTEIVRAQIKIMCEQITIEIAKDLQHVLEYAERTEDDEG